MANPRAVANFAKAMMSRSKTDPMDAEVLREFVERMPFVGWVPPSQAALELRAASRRLDSLSNMLTREKNRLHAARATKTTISIVSDDLKSSINTLKVVSNDSSRRLNRSSRPSHHCKHTTDD